MHPHILKTNNKWYPQMCLLALFEATVYFSRSELSCPFATAKIECSFKMGEQTPLGPGTIYFAVDGT